eukprot:g64761.t1
MRLLRSPAALQLSCRYSVRALSSLRFAHLSPAVERSLSLPLPTTAVRMAHTDAQGGGQSLASLAPVAFIGGGNMSEAICAGLIAKQAVPPSLVRVSDPVSARRKIFRDRGIVALATASNLEACKDCRLVVLCHKPQQCGKVFAELKGALLPEAVVVSICAGVEIESIQKGLDHKKVIRTMPNTPAMVQGAMTVWCSSPEVTEQEKAGIQEFLQAFGQEEEVLEESYLDMATALSGTGPAYFFLLIETLVDAGVHMGFPRATAEKLVRQTSLGSACYASKFSNVHPTKLRNDITSPGGTTAAALYAADKGNFRNVVTDAVWAAYERSKELGQQSRSSKPKKK